MIQLKKDIEIPKLVGGYDLYKADETYIGFVYRVDPQIKSINIDANLYTADGVYLNGLGLQIRIHQNVFYLGDVVLESESENLLRDTIDSILVNDWEWVLPTPMLGETIGDYVSVPE